MQIYTLICYTCLHNGPYVFYPNLYKSPKINNYTYLELSGFYRYWCHMHLLTHFQRAASARGLQPFAANLCCFQLIFCLVVLAVLALYCRFRIVEAI